MELELEIFEVRRFFALPCARWVVIITCPMKQSVTALLVFVASACGDGGSVAGPDATFRNVVTAPKMLLVGEIAESIFTGGVQDMATITLTAPVEKLDWNLHGHAGGTTVTVKEELGVLTASYGFTPSAQGDWFLLIRNRDALPMTVDVKIELFGAMTWSGWP